MIILMTTVTSPEGTQERKEPLLWSGRPSSSKVPSLRTSSSTTRTPLLPISFPLRRSLIFGMILGLITIFPVLGTARNPQEPQRSRQNLVPRYYRQNDGRHRGNISVIKLAEQLPDWSKSGNPKYKPSYEAIRSVALDFLELSPDARRAEIQEYARLYCFPEMNLPKASGLYLLLRVVFDLPSELPRDKAQVFGGWLHPSVGESSATFNMSWPVTVQPTKRSLAIQRFTGYFGRSYMAFDEYNYFVKTFPFRARVVLEEYTFVPTD